MKRFFPIWLPAWLALIPVGMLVSGAAPSAEMAITGGAAYAFSLSIAPAIAAALVLYFWRKKPDGGRYLAAWFAVAATIWIGTTALDMHKSDGAPKMVVQTNAPAQMQNPVSPDQLGVLNDQVKEREIDKALGGMIFIIGGVCAFIYFTEPKMGLRRLSLAISIGFGLMITTVFLAGSISFGYISETTSFGFSIGAITTLVILFFILSGSAAVRWIRSGFINDRAISANKSSG